MQRKVVSKKKDMARVENLSKVRYKILLLLIKYIPSISMLGYIMSSFLSFIGYNTEIFSYFGGLSLLSWLYMLLSSFVFKFCIFHRLPLYYMIVIDSLNIYDYYKGIPLDNFKLLMLHAIITGITILLIIYFYAKCHKKPTE